MIELTRASFQYENSDRGVRDISLSVKGGECVVLTGLAAAGEPRQHDAFAAFYRKGNVLHASV